MNHYILILNDVIKTFSIAGSGVDIQYTFAYKDKQDVFIDTKSGDKVLGYVDDPTDQFRYVFEVIQKLSDKECIFKKKIEIEEGPVLRDTAAQIVSSVTANKGRNLFLKISESQYNDVIRFMLNKSRKTLESREEESSKPICFENDFKTNFERNRIIFGAPGTGKSFTMNDEKDKLLAEGGYFERVTFHPNYSYANFVGTYKPVSKKDKFGNEIIVYEYVPGPFMRVLVKALENSRKKGTEVKPYILLIEEINRANVAAVFGEVFQLLDRNSKNASEYTIQPSEDIKKYLINTIHVSEEEIMELKIPDNMFIWATMNSADQGVFPMDTAFKRRWEFEYIGINDEEDKVKDYIIPIGNTENRKYIRWNDIRNKINDILSSEECKVNEDKLLGPFFMSKNLLESALEDEEAENHFVKAFESKVIMYLFEDVMKMRPKNIFRGHTGKMIFSDICMDFEVNREKLFDIEGLEYIENN